MLKVTFLCFLTHKGAPKGICHSHTSAWNWGGYSNSFIKEHSNTVTTTCFFHVGGFFTGINACVKHQSYYHVRGIINFANIIIYILCLIILWIITFQRITNDLCNDLMLDISIIMQMFGEEITLQMILDAVSASKAKTLYLGTHHYVKLSRSQEFQRYESKQLASLQYIIPTGASIPTAYMDSIANKLLNFVCIWNGYMV